LDFEETDRTIKLVLEERNIFPKGHVEEEYKNKDFLDLQQKNGD
jgi:hypothetical protein